MIGETNLSILIKNMHPILNKGEYVFCTVAERETFDLDKIIGFFREKEGSSLIVEKNYAEQKNWKYTSSFAWIRLEVHSSLDAVGLTATFSKALAEQKISCNVVAGFYHDHIFVPYHLAQKAIEILIKLTKI